MYSPGEALISHENHRGHRRGEAYCWRDAGKGSNDEQNASKVESHACIPGNPVGEGGQ